MLSTGGIKMVPLMELDGVIETSHGTDFDILEVNFEFNELTFLPGSIFSGSIKIFISGPRNINNVTMNIKGVAECAWYHKSRIYSKQQTILNHKMVLIEENSCFEAGSPYQDLEYTFTVRLPTLIPGTWTGTHGRIFYYAEVMFPSHDHKKYTKFFFVEPYRNLKCEPYLQYESMIEVTKKFRNVFLPLGKVIVSIWIPLSGFIPGQSIPILCKVENNSKVCVTAIVFVLTMFEIYRSQIPLKSTKVIRKDVAQVSRITEAFDGTFLYFCSLVVPKKLSPTNLSIKCQTCQVKYELWASVQPGLPRYWAYGYPNIDTPAIPVIIGTIPLKQWDERLVAKDVQRASGFKEPEERDSILVDPSDVSLLAKINQPSVAAPSVLSISRPQILCTQSP